MLWSPHAMAANRKHGRQCCHFSVVGEFLVVLGVLVFFMFRGLKTVSLVAAKDCKGQLYVREPSVSQKGSSILLVSRMLRQVTKLNKLGSANSCVSYALIYWCCTASFVFPCFTFAPLGSWRVVVDVLLVCMVHCFYCFTVV